MASETFTVTEGERSLEFELYWSKTWYDMIISDKQGGELLSRLMFLPHPAVLREMAEQFYAWADTLESEFEGLKELKE
jgi:hypothetical protein